MDCKKINKFDLQIDDNIDKLCKTNNIKNLLNLTSTTTIDIFDKRRKHIKSDIKLLKECDLIKKKSISTISKLSNLAKLSNSESCNIITKNTDIIDNINNIIKLLNSQDKYIECYSNE